MGKSPLTHQNPSTNMLGATPTLRTAAIGCRLQPVLFAPYTYPTTSSPSLRRNQSTTTCTGTSTTPSAPRRRVQIPKRNVTFKPTSTVVRHASTATSPHSSTATASEASAPGSDLLDWNTFFKLRKTRRWYQLGSSVTTGIGGFVGGAQVLTMSDMDALVSQIPLDHIHMWRCRMAGGTDSRDGRVQLEE